MKYQVDDEVIVNRTNKTHKIVSCSMRGDFPFYALDNKTHYWEYELSAKSMPAVIANSKN